MVQGQTANEIGDWLIASIVDPYKNVVRVTDYEILAGISNANTVGTINLVEGSTTVSGFGTVFNLQAGDSIIIGNTVLEVASQVSTMNIELVNPAPFSASNATFMVAENSNNFFTYKYRYSNTNEEYSEFRPLNKDNNPGDLFFLTFDGTMDLYLDVRAEVDSLSMGSSITLISVTFTVENEDGIIESCPQYCIDCADPYSYSGCANIKVECEDATNNFQPYSLTKNNNLYNQLVEISSDIFGHEVRYYRTEPDQRSRDVIFKEYSLFHVADVGNLKVSVPDNEFPTESFEYDIFGMGFEDFEIHITDYQFRKTFGEKLRPRSKDYLYFPINNKMYEVKMVELADEFNVQHTYWRVMLTKYQERSSVEKPADIELEMQDLVVGVDEIFGVETQEEYIKDTKPQQLKTTSFQWDDGVRQSSAAKLKIVDYDLKNRWTIVSKNYYDLSSIATDDVAIDYVYKSKQDIDKNLAFTCWFSPVFDTNADNYKYQLINGEQFGNGFVARISNTKLEIVINGQIHTFLHNMILGSDEWYGIIINMSNTFRELSVSIYYLDLSNNANRPQDSNNNLELQFSETRSLTQAYVWDLDKHYQLRGGRIKLTNIRLWNKTIEEEQHSNILNQSLVRDAHLAKIIDNAIPSLSYQRYYNAR
jgi:hypothetical protein